MDSALEKHVRAFRAAERHADWAPWFFACSLSPAIGLLVLAAMSSPEWEPVTWSLFVLAAMATLVSIAWWLARPAAISRTGCDLIDAASADDLSSLEGRLGTEDFLALVRCWSIHRCCLRNTLGKFHQLQRHTTADGCRCGFWDGIFEYRPDLKQFSVIRCSPT